LRFELDLAENDDEDEEAIENIFILFLHSR